jgi:hypothetical protein
MLNYSKEILPINEGYVIQNHKIGIIIFSYFSLIFGIILVPYLLFTIINEYKNGGDFSDLFVLIFPSFLIAFPFFIGFYDIGKIIININKNMIFFIYRLEPFSKTIKLKINEIKEISINYSYDYRGVGLGLGSYNYDNKTIGYERDYNVDLIDNNMFSYRIYQSKEYDDVIIFAKNISEIIKININDQNNTEGKNIYKKNVI